LIDRGLIQLVEWQIGFGPRLPGTVAHRDFIAALKEKVSPHADELYLQDFTIHFCGKDVLCTNVITVKKASGQAATTITRGDKLAGPILLGTHFDTRLIADNETDPVKRNTPIPGANDGGSGTAILSYLLPVIASRSYSRDIHVVFFDAEDVGNIDGFDFSTGAQYLADHPLPVPPAEVLVLDMVGGSDMVLDMDAHFLENDASRAFGERIINKAVKTGYAPLLTDKPGKWKYIVCDHYPFHKAGIPSFALIDIDYPEWHTQGDLPRAMSEDSLAATAQFVLDFLEEWWID